MTETAPGRRDPDGQRQRPAHDGGVRARARGLRGRRTTSASSPRTAARRRPPPTRARPPSRGLRVIIAGAGGAAHLAGAMAAHSTLPVIGVPLDSSPLGGFDALLATVQMPPGVPVAAVGVGSMGAKNAGHLAVAILALQDDALRAQPAGQAARRWRKRSWPRRRRCPTSCASSSGARSHDRRRAAGRARRSLARGRAGQPRPQPRRRRPGACPRAGIPTRRRTWPRGWRARARCAPDSFINPSLPLYLDAGPSSWVQARGRARRACWPAAPPIPCSLGRVLSALAGAAAVFVLGLAAARAAPRPRPAGRGAPRRSPRAS